MIKIENIKLAKASDVENLQTNKVDKVEGKGLSTNDYTNADKDKLSWIGSMITESTWNAKIGSHGSITIERIAVIQPGESTAGIPNNTLILELE